MCWKLCIKGAELMFLALVQFDGCNKDNKTKPQINSFESVYSPRVFYDIQIENGGV